MKATVGRIVHFYNSALASGDSPQPGSAGPGFNGAGAGPYPAIVTQTFPGSDYVNLKVLPPFAPPYDEGSVSEVPDAEGLPQGDYRAWCWPPRD